MSEKRSPDLDMFARQFRQRYGREITPKESRFYQLTKELLDNPPDEREHNEDAA